MSAKITRHLQDEWILLHRVSVGGLHRRHSAVLQKKWCVEGVEGNRWSQALLDAVMVYIYLYSCTVDMWMVDVGVGCDFCCIKDNAVFCLSGVFSYCWLLTVQSDVSGVLGDITGQLCQCVLHCMSWGLVQTCCQSWGLSDHVESEFGCHFVNWFQNGKYVLHLWYSGDLIIFALNIISCVPCLFFLPIFVVDGVGLCLLMWESGRALPVRTVMMSLEFRNLCWLITDGFSSVHEGNYDRSLRNMLSESICVGGILLNDMPHRIVSVSAD